VSITPIPMMMMIVRTNMVHSVSTKSFALSPERYFLGPSTFLSTIFRASSNAPAGVENGIVVASLSPSSSYTVTMKYAASLACDGQSV
jgi:hypothetical protein